jgi:hypothetical protein
VLSRLVVYSLAVSFALLSSSLSALFSFWTLLLFGLLKNMNSLLKLFSLSRFVVGYMFLVLCIKCSWFKCLFWGGLVCVDALFLLSLLGFWNYGLVWKKNYFRGFEVLIVRANARNYLAILGI